MGKEIHTLDVKRDKNSIKAKAGEEERMNYAERWDIKGEYHCRRTNKGGGVDSH